jgi:Transposase DNA-binding
MDRTAAFTFDDAVEQMGQCFLGDVRRTRRLVDTTRRIAAHPGGSLPEKVHDPAAYQATLRLVNQLAVTHAAVLRPHRQATLAHIRQSTATVLLVHDTTELDYSNQMTLSAMGQIGNGGGWGYQCHNTLAVDAASGALIGLASQVLHNRVRKPKNEGVAASRARLNRESRLWIKGVQQVGKAPDGCHWVDVCDRGADTFEFLQYERQHGRPFVVRSSYNRALEVVGQGEPHLLHDYLRTQPAQVGWTVRVAANPKQPARTANGAVQLGAGDGARPARQTR